MKPTLPPDAFFEYPLKKHDHKPDYLTTLCPVCQGHGGWNYKINAYKLPQGIENTAENRHKYAHQRVFCNQCVGWGMVRPEDALCIHDWAHKAKLGNCWNLYRCTDCGKEKEVDSSG